MDRKNDFLLSDINDQTASTTELRQMSMTSTITYGFVRYKDHKNYNQLKIKESITTVIFDISNKSIKYYIMSKGEQYLQKATT